MARAAQGLAGCLPWAAPRLGTVRNQAASRGQCALPVCTLPLTIARDDGDVMRTACMLHRFVRLSQLANTTTNASMYIARCGHKLLPPDVCACLEGQLNQMHVGAQVGRTSHRLRLLEPQLAMFSSKEGVVLPPS